MTEIVNKINGAIYIDLHKLVVCVRARGCFKYFGTEMRSESCEPFEPEPDNTGVGMVTITLLLIPLFYMK